MSEYQSYLEGRIDLEVKYICEYNLTIRKVASLIGVSKSTVHRDLTVILKKYSYTNYLRVREVLDEHITTRHLRGGEATRIKYKKLKESKSNRHRIIKIYYFMSIFIFFLLILSSIYYFLNIMIKYRKFQIMPKKNLGGA